MKTEVVRLRVSPEMKDKIKSAADRDNRTISNWIENLIKKEIEMKQTYIITEQAYLTGTNDHPIYQATGIDKDGNKVMLTWEIREGYDPAQQQEDQACDWENPDSAEIIEDAKDYLESLALGGECRQYPGKGCDYIIIKDDADQEVVYAEELVPEDESEEDANWNQPRIDRLVAEIKDQLKSIELQQ